jgi:hypothetical protein
MVGAGTPKSSATWLAHLPVPFLLGGVQNLVDQRRGGLGVGALKDVCGDVDQVAAQLALVPRGELLAHFCRRQAQLLHEVVGLANHLHVGVFDGVVHHLHKMARTARPHPLATGLTVFGLGGNGLQQGLDQRPGLWRSAGHEGRAPQSALFTTTDPRAHKQNARCTQGLDAPLRIGVQRVAAVHDHVAGLQQGAQFVEHRVNRLAGRHHDQQAARALELRHQVLQAGGRLGGLCPPLEA